MTEASLITRETMMPLLFEADPSFEPGWREWLAEWEEEDELPIYLALADVARRLIGQLESGDTGRFQKVFDVVEQWHIAGDDYVRTAATIGLLESLQTSNFFERGQPSFEEWLQPCSRKFWAKVIRFWDHGEIIIDD